MRGSKYYKSYKKSKYSLDDPIYQIHEWNVDIKNNQIHLMGEESYTQSDLPDAEPGVEYVMANRFIRNLNICMRQNPHEPILIHMKTCGGFWNEGMAIYDCIKACPSPITILNYTHARSMSSLIFQAADKRVMMPNSYFLFHRGTMGIEGETKTVQSNMEYDKSLEPVMINIYVDQMKKNGKFSKWSKDRIYKMLSEKMDKKSDVFLTAEESVEWGLADEVFGKPSFNWEGLTKYTDSQLGD